MEEVCSFHSFCSYYRSFVPGFATVCHPIMQLTVKGCKVCVVCKVCIQVAQGTTLVLAYLDPEAPTTLDTLGPVVSQKDPQGKERVLGCAGWALNKL